MFENDNDDYSGNIDSELIFSRDMFMEKWKSTSEVCQKNWFW